MNKKILDRLFPFMVLPFTLLIIVQYFTTIDYNAGNYYVFAKVSEPQYEGGPQLKDASLNVEVIFRGIQFPTSMDFLNSNDILVLEKNEGTVRRIVNGTIIEDPLLHLSVGSEGERGLLGIAIQKPNHLNQSHPHVFLFLTEKKEDENNDGNYIYKNRLYRYELLDNKLRNPLLLLDIPAEPGNIHNGGVMEIGNEGDIYVTVGDIQGPDLQKDNSPNGRGGILKIPITSDIHQNITNDVAIPYDPTIHDYYYAYGIRNSFGIDFDPVTGNLWDTENGPGHGDEINLVGEGFNSGWQSIQGFWNGKDEVSFDHFIEPHDLSPLDFEYSEPELATFRTLGLTALSFIDSEIYGEKYKNDMLVGDFHNGYLYLFELNSERNELILDSLENKIAYDRNSLEGDVFGHGFGGVTDIEIGPDGFIYVLSLYQGGGNCNSESDSENCIDYESAITGTIFKISPKDL